MSDFGGEARASLVISYAETPTRTGHRDLQGASLVSEDGENLAIASGASLLAH